MLRRFILTLIFGLGLALAAVVVFRAALVEMLLADRLVAQGVAVGSLSVTRVGLKELHIADLSLGANGELTARALRIAYQPDRLLEGEVAEVTAEGLTLRLDFTGTAPFGSLQPLLAGDRDGPGVALPVFELIAGRIEAETPLGPVTIRLDGEAWPEDEGAIAGVFSFALESTEGRLNGAFDVTRAPDGTISGNLVVEDGTLSLLGAKTSELLGEAIYALAPGRPPELDAWLSAPSAALPSGALPGGALEETQITLHTAGQTAEFTARLRGPGGAWSLALTGALADYLAAPAIRVAASGTVEAEADLWTLMALPTPAAGRTSFQVEANGTLAPLEALGNEGVTASAWLDRAKLTGQLAARVAGLSYPGQVESVGGKFRFDVALEDSSLAFQPARPARLAFAGLNPDWLRGLGLPAPVVPLFERGVTLILDARGNANRKGLTGPVALTVRTPGGAELDAQSDLRLVFGEEHAIEQVELDALQIVARRLPLPDLRLREFQATGTLTGTPPALAGALDLRLTAENVAVQALRAAGAEASLPVALQTGPGTLTVHQTGPGQVTLRDAAYGETLQLAALKAGVTAGELAYAAGVLDHGTTLDIASTPIRLKRADGDLIVELTPGTVEFRGSWTPDAPYRATAKIAGAGLVLPVQEIAVAEVAGSLVLGPAPGALAAEIAFGAISDRAEAPRFAPLAGLLSARGTDQALTFKGELGDLSGAVRLGIAGQHDLTAGRGAANLALEPLAFAPGGLQPAALAPGLVGLQEVAGALRAEAGITWTGDGLAGDAELAIDDLSFNSAAAVVEDLDLKLALSSLMPPASASGQRLTVRRIDPGVALDEVAVRFQIHPGNPLRLGIEEGQFRFSGGRVLLRDLSLDPAAPRLDLPFEVEDLDLAELFRILDIDGLSGTGHLSGQIPVAIVTEGEGVTIAGGRLTAQAPGTLRLESEQARQALAGAGESADLMFHALQDFRYDELSLAIEKPAAAAARLTLVLLGHNPDVLDGYPFRFNINLEGDTDRLIAALSQAYSLSNRMLRQLWRPKRK